MGIFILETGLLIGLAISPVYKQSDRQVPFFLVEQNFKNRMYIKNYNENEMTEFKTRQSKMQFEVGYKSSIGINFALGHNEQFQTDSKENFNMGYDYIKISYRIELK